MPEEKKVFEPKFADPSDYSRLGFDKLDDLHKRRILAVVKEVPTVEQKADWFKMMKWNGIYYALIYGKSIIEWVTSLVGLGFAGKFAGKTWEKFVKWKYGLEQREIKF